MNEAILLSGVNKKIDKSKITNVQGNFCNLRDADDIPIFDSFIDWLYFNNRSKANDWIARLKGAGSTHINLDISGDYAENLGWAPRYPVPGSDWTNNLSSFKRLLDWVLNNNLIPIIHLAADGNEYDPIGWSYGMPWAYQNLPRIIKSLVDYTRCALWNPGWDGCFANSGWTPESTVTFLRFMRMILGDDAAIAIEFNGPGSVAYDHLGNGPSDWTKDKLGILDAFFIELNILYPNADLSEGVREVATRQLGPGALQGPTTPWYLENLDTITVLFETCAYPAIRKQISPSYAVEIANWGKSFGFKYFGNGLPS